MAEKIATRQAYGEALLEMGGLDKRIVALDADVSTCTMSCHFGEKYPERFFNVGIAEANMVGMAAGMAASGLVPFVHTFAMFCAGRAFEQIRNSVAYPRLNVKLVGTHAGLSVGEDGATHQCIEDLALMRSIPGMTVICPADGNETRAAVRALARHEGPAYLRLGRLPLNEVTGKDGNGFEIGKARQLRAGNDAAIVAIGMMVEIALDAAELLMKDGISVRVLDMHTIKPIDRASILAAAAETGLIVTAEEHNILGGLGGAVAEIVAEETPVPVLRVGVEDVFGKSGKASALIEKFGLTREKVAEKVKFGLDKKRC